VVTIKSYWPPVSPSFAASRSSNVVRGSSGADLPGVQVVLPVYARTMGFQYHGSELSVYFMALDAPEGLPLPGDTRARYFPAPGRVNIDSAFSQKTGLGHGDALRVGDRDLVVDRINSGGNAVITQFAFLNAADARAIFGIAGGVNFYLLTTQPGADPLAVGAAAAAAVPGAEFHTSASFANAISKAVDEGFLPVVSVLVGIGMIVGGAVIGLTTYTATIEKSRDFGVLKALGASGAFLYRIVITQSLIVCALGSIAGIVASALAATLIKRWIPEFITQLLWTDVAVVFAAALVMAVVSSYLPVRRINGIDPAMVFRA
jgi:putative ABC transport system permease protein